MITTEGKPTLFFSASHADKSWRLTEKIVAVIESFLQGRDELFTLSSARIRDMAGDLEEVDVAYASMADPMDVFSSIEVRDRKEKVGRQYIQEIIGKRESLGIDTCKVVSTIGFTRDAIRLASHSEVNIPLRVLHPETEENIRKWYRADFIGAWPMVQIVKWHVEGTKVGTIQESEVDRVKTSENNILVPTRKPHTYRVVPLPRVFDVEVMQHQKRRHEFLAKVPEYGAWQEVSVSIPYDKPRLYWQSGALFLSIERIDFLVATTRPFPNAPITHRHKYLDAVTNQKIAEAIVAEATIEHQGYYICLARYSWVGETFQLGGGFFR